LDLRWAAEAGKRRRGTSAQPRQGSDKQASSGCSPMRQIAHSSSPDSPRTATPVVLQARRAASTSADVKHGTASLFASSARTGIDGTEIRAARAAAAITPATSLRPRCVWYHAGSGSRGSAAKGWAPAARSTSAMATLAASCSGVRTLKPFLLRRGSAPPSRRTRTASSEPEAAAACRAVVGAVRCPARMRIKGDDRTTALGEETRGRSSATCSAWPRAAAATNAMSSSRSET